MQLSFSEIVNANEHLNGEEETKKIVQSMPESKRYYYIFLFTNNQNDFISSKIHTKKINFRDDINAFCSRRFSLW